MRSYTADNTVSNTTTVSIRVFTVSTVAFRKTKQPFTGWELIKVCMEAVAETLLDGKEGQQPKGKVQQIALPATSNKESRTVLPRCPDPARLSHSKRLILVLKLDCTFLFSR
ncbi:hypothetical protein AMECASPLE_034119 [Ameca splendens]|uniref:Uncharacterized protein n=1 Tax=Ameca splendens TaxID=208324 RepID=A0ABV0YI31_9TELE